MAWPPVGCLMRSQAPVESTREPLPSRHFGLGYRDRNEFLGRAAEFAADGLRNNQRLAYIADRSRAALRSELSAMPGVSEHLDSGVVQVIPANNFYAFRRGGEVVDAELTLDRYVAAFERATAGGYAGLRVVVDVTPVARTPEQRAAMAQLEYLGDQEIAMRPASVLCGYDASQLGSGADELICLHRDVSKGQVMFQLYCEPAAKADFALAGEIDAASGELFATTLQRVWELIPGPTLHIDAEKLEFISHEQLCLLERSAQAQNRNVILRTSQPIPNRLVGLLDLTRVQVQAVS